MFSLLIWLVFGLIVGVVAKLFHPGKEDLGILETAGLGIAGSFVGGILHWIMSMGGSTLSPGGFAWSILGAVVLCYGYSYYKSNK